METGITTRIAAAALPLPLPLLSIRLHTVYTVFLAHPSLPAAVLPPSPYRRPPSPLSDVILHTGLTYKKQHKMSSPTSDKVVDESSKPGHINNLR
jgi:hypothetical protein